MRKTLAPKKKLTSRRPKARTAIAPTKLATAAIERIRAVLEQSGRTSKLQGPLGRDELAARERLFGSSLPPSYVAAMEVAQAFGEPELVLDAAGIAEAQRALVSRFGDDGETRYFPFARTDDAILAFDRGIRVRRFGSVPPPTRDGELQVVEIEGGVARPLSYSFGHWLDEVADAREESMA